MFPDPNGQLGARLIIATIVVALALILFFLVSRAWRNRGTRTFLRGGGNRQPRLAVLDAAAVDAKRRLVLVRRDDIEHLILIGGPTDIVVESRIGAERTAATQPQRAATTAVQDAPATAENAVGRREQPRPAPAAATEANAAPAPTTKPGPGGNDRAEMPAARTKAAPDAVPVKAPAPAIESRSARPPAVPQASAGAAETPVPATGELPAADVATLLDGERERVFGPPAVKQDSPYVRAYTDDAPQEPARPATLPKAAFSASVLRFDDFLDTETAGDLSKVTPAGSEKPAPSAPSLRDARAAASPARRDDALDDEMARLLGEISPKR